jgi:hypothetical protein
MHGAAMAKNIRRTGIPATIKGKPNPIYPVSTGPTLERIAKAENHFAVGDDKRGNRVYHFHDSPLDRMYSRLTRQAKSLSGEQGLRREYIALVKYRHHWFSAKPGIVVDNIVCAETSIEAAGWSIGFNSRTQARDKAEEVLRESGRKLAKLWGIS